MTARTRNSPRCGTRTPSSVRLQWSNCSSRWTTSSSTARCWTGAGQHRRATPGHPRAADDAAGQLGLRGKPVLSTGRFHRRHRSDDRAHRTAGHPPRRRNRTRRRISSARCCTPQARSVPTSAASSWSSPPIPRTRSGRRAQPRSLGCAGSCRRTSPAPAPTCGRTSPTQPCSLRSGRGGR